MDAWNLAAVVATGATTWVAQKRLIDKVEGKISPYWRGLWVIALLLAGDLHPGLGHV